MVVERATRFRSVRLLVPEVDPGRLPDGFDGPGYSPVGRPAVFGRGGAVALVWPDGRECFVREYRHGGFLGRVLGRCYLSDSVLRRELEDSARLAEGRVEVARPVLGRVEGRWFCRLALVTEQVDGRSLGEVVGDACTRGVLQQVGQACARMHRLGFRHKDLHPGNVIVRGDGTPVVLDLGGGSWGGAHADTAAKASLLRMARWIEKHHGQPVSVPEALGFLSGYEPERGARHALMRELAQDYERTVGRHRLTWRRSSER